MSEPVIDREAVLEALRFQRAGFGLDSLSSPLYAVLSDAAVADVEAGGPCAEVLDRTPPGIDPIPDALALRFLGAVHRLVLRGGAPDLAAFFPTAGGAFEHGRDDAAAAAAFVAAVADNADELADGLAQGVQTNEVGRCAALAVGFTEVLRRHGLPLRLLELGASAGFNLRWDRWRYRAAGTAWGPEDAALVFDERTAYQRDPRPDLSAPLPPTAAVAERAGCDRNPIDPTTEEGRILLTGFVWPDQPGRHRRLVAALAAAGDVPTRPAGGQGAGGPGAGGRGAGGRAAGPRGAGGGAAGRVAVERADAAAWLADRLAHPVPGTTTVVYHSIVWQYLPAATRAGVLDALRRARRRAPADAPVHWLRMEPGEDPAAGAEVRLDGDLLAHSGYHGHPVWRAATLDA